MKKLLTALIISSSLIWNCYAENKDLTQADRYVADLFVLKDHKKLYELSDNINACSAVLTYTAKLQKIIMQKSKSGSLDNPPTQSQLESIFNNYTQVKLYLAASRLASIYIYSFAETLKEGSYSKTKLIDTVDADIDEKTREYSEHITKKYLGLRDTLIQLHRDQKLCTNVLPHITAAHRLVNNAKASQSE